MTRLIAITIAFLAIHPLSAQEKFDYATALALATERTMQKAADHVFILGPEQNEELYTVNGREMKRTLPYCAAVSDGEARTMEHLLDNIRLPMDNTNYQISVYRSGSLDPVVRVQGTFGKVKRSQFPLKSGDIIVITDISTKK